MIRLLLFLLFIACLGLSGALIAETPGSLTLTWYGWRIDTSAAFLVLVLALSAMFLAGLMLFLRSLALAPKRYSEHRRLAHYQQAIGELTYSVAALAASDSEAAAKHARKVEKLLGASPLTVLLSAQIAKSKGDEIQTRALLEQLLDYKETEYLAARSLSDAASKHNVPRALELAKQAYAMHPKDAKAALAVTSLQTRLGAWDEALATLQKAPLPRAEKQRLRALAQVAYGQALHSEGRDAEALALARKALHSLPDFAPACALAATSYAEHHQLRKAVRTLTRAWPHERHPLLKETLDDIAKAEPEAKQEKLRALLPENPSHGHWLCGTCGHAAQRWTLHCGHCESFAQVEWK